MLGGLVGAADLVGGGVLLTGAGILVRLGSAAWKIINSAKLEAGNGNGSNGAGEWRGRIETLIEQGQILQRDTAGQLLSISRSQERGASVLERLAERLTEHIDQSKTEHEALRRELLRA